MDTENLVEFARSKLRVHADSQKAAEMAAYMKTDQPFYGVSSPLRAAIGKELFAAFIPKTREDYEAGVRALWSGEHREEQYLALGFARKWKRFISSDSLELYEELIREGAWWDLVDETTSHLVSPVLLKERVSVRPLLACWIDDECMWIRRAAILSQLKHRSETDEEMLFDFCLKRSHEKEFFIRKAIGWALREYSYYEPERVEAFVTRNRELLSGLSYREATRVIEKVKKEKRE
ncbi:DNA alkylation repair protein [Microvenator marinus]|uniref:DNA alkylation repair protein n=1 Tax=Microvenator marinus TaxID=2600177 RepID=A0A5B8XSU1_9DELT|nr:DNA alkylation repair protein [Microvenator marinus]QED26706.1 DNA alkylation repair protein [Microvenator marinus]